MAKDKSMRIYNMKINDKQMKTITISNMGKIHKVQLREMNLEQTNRIEYLKDGRCGKTLE